ncbi:hypothetical protein Mapa_017506 [Marchantia paleacea]|nr:hypothetical protein Mapa_017506 [Marchantia paleacea]
MGYDQLAHPVSRLGWRCPLSSSHAFLSYFYFPPSHRPHDRTSTRLTAENKYRKPLPGCSDWVLSSLHRSRALLLVSEDALRATVKFIGTYALEPFAEFWNDDSARTTVVTKADELRNRLL